MSSEDNQCGAGRTVEGIDEGVTRTTAGDGAWKGFGDDYGCSARYDKAPSGTFAQRAAASVGIPPFAAVALPDLLDNGP